MVTVDLFCSDVSNLIREPSLIEDALTADAFFPSKDCVPLELLASEIVDAIAELSQAISILENATMVKEQPVNCG